MKKGYHPLLYVVIRANREIQNFSQYAYKIFTGKATGSPVQLIRLSQLGRTKGTYIYDLYKEAGGIMPSPFLFKYLKIELI